MTPSLPGLSPSDWHPALNVVSRDGMAALRQAAAQRLRCLTKASVSFVKGLGRLLSLGQALAFGECLDSHGLA